MMGFILGCELVVCALTVLVYFAIGRLALPVVLGAVLGALVMVGNFAALAVISSRAVDGALSERPAGELSDEAVEAFVAEHQARLKLRIRLSQNIRMIMMLALLVVALITPWFDPIAALVPMLLFRPILMLMGLVLRDKTPPAPAQVSAAEDTGVHDDTTA